MKNFFFPLFLFLSYAPAAAVEPAAAVDAPPACVEVRDLKDDSGYKGPWKPGPGISALLRESLPEDYYRLEKSTGTYVLEGSVREFVLSSRGIASYGIGGYQEYSATVVLEVSLRGPDGTPLLTRSRVESRIVSRDLGLSILGGPVGDDSHQDELKTLWNLPFGSPAFRSSVLGQAVQKAIDRTIPRVSLALYGRPFGLAGEIVEVRGDRVYIDLGREDGITPGLELVIYSPERTLRDPDSGEPLGTLPREAVGRLTIAELRGPHLSAGTVSGKSRDVKEHDAVVLE